MIQRGHKADSICNSDTYVHSTPY